jgi:hypothetical protein
MLLDLCGSKESDLFAVGWVQEVKKKIIALADVFHDLARVNLAVSKTTRGGISWSKKTDLSI